MEKTISKEHLKKTFRKKMCDDCAFRIGAEETNTQQKRDEFYMHCHAKIFMCHKTMFDQSGRNLPFEGQYTLEKDNQGNPTSLENHQLCAGFVALHGIDIGIQKEEVQKIDISEHVYFQPK